MPSSRFINLDNLDFKVVYVCLSLLIAAHLNFLIFGLHDFGIALRGDSLSYLQGAHERTVGYPLFLWLMQQFPAFPANVAVVQLNLSLAALTLFGWLVSDLARARWVAIFVLVLAAGHTRYIAQSLSLLSESLFITLLLLHFATAAYAVKQNNWLAYLLMGITCAGVMLIRPAGYFLFASLAFWLWLNRATLTRRTSTALLLPIAASLLLACMANYLRHGHFSTQAIGGYSLVGHIAWNIRPGDDSRYRILAERIQARLEPILDQRPAGLSYPYDYQQWTTDEYNLLLWDSLVPELEAFLEVTGDPAAANAVASDLARETILRDPMGYLRHAFAHYLGLWRFVFIAPQPLEKRLSILSQTSAFNIARTPNDLTMQFEPTKREFSEAAGPVRFSANALRLPWSVLSVSPRAFSTIFIVLSILWAGASLKDSEPSVKYLGYLGVSLQSYMGLVAAVQVALPRYSIVVMPLAVAMLLVSVASAMRRIRKTTESSC